MPTKHVTWLIEAYLDNRLSEEERRLVEAHLALCPTCRNQLFAAQQVAAELKPTLEAVFGSPLPPPALRYRVQQALQAQEPPRPRFNWAMTGRVLNAVGTIAVIALLVFGAFVVIRGPLLKNTALPEIASLSSSNDGGGEVDPQPTATLTPPPTVLAAKGASLGDTLPHLALASPNSPAAGSFEPTPIPFSTQAGVNSPTLEAAAANTPTGTIAFSLFNPTAYPQGYQIHLINPDGSNHRLFPLNGVSEPALHSPSGPYQLAYRAWGQPTSPRSLLSSQLDGERPQRIGGFWEDAQPDWSPTEDRLIFASQRENDRRWRLYTSWGDGGAELNLRREGKSPTFAPDGYRFAFESCTETGLRCGLWLGDLENSEYGSKPFLLDPLAQSPDWAPEGETIAYMSNPEGNWDLYLVNSDGSQKRRLTDDPVIDGLPAWSPDGQWLAFLSNRGGSWGLWLLHLESGQTRQIYRLNEGTFTPPNISPYGERSWLDEQISWSE